MRIWTGSNACKTYVIVLSFAAFCTQSVGQQLPDWYTRTQFFAGFEVGYFLNGGPQNGPQYANAAPFTGESWGFEPPEPGREFLEAREISMWHAAGRLYHPGTWIDSPQQALPGVDPFPNSQAAICTNISGTTLTTSGLVPNSLIEYSISSTAYQQYLTGELKQAIDEGADGFQFDGVGYLASTVLNAADQAGCFDSATMAAFAAYLAAKYSTADLSSMFQITDVSTFNFQQWITQQGAQKTWNQQPLSGLAREFFEFQMIAEKTFLQQVTAFAHQYASAMYNRTVTVSANTAFQRFGQAYFDGVDYFVNETHFLSPTVTQTPFSTADIKSYKAVRPWPVVAELERIASTSSRQDFPPNLVRLAIADVYGAGGIVSAGHGSPALPMQPLEPLGALPGATGPPPAFTSGALSSYGQFVVGHPALFQNLQPISQVALLDSTASRNGWLFPVAAVPGFPPPSSYAFGDGHYYGAARLLIDSNLQYDSVLAPDSSISSLPSFTLAQLQKYSVLLLPDAYALNNGQANTILEYLQDGGVVLALGPVATNEPDGSAASRPQLQMLQSVEGATPYGKGVFVYTSDGVDLNYFIADSNSDNATKLKLLQQFQSLISPYLTARIATSQVSTVFRTGGATAFLFSSPANSTIMQLVNYDYDLASDSTAAKDNVQVTLDAGSQAFDEVILWSPDNAGPQVLPFQRSGSTVAFTVPNLNVWDVLSLQQNAAAPVIQSTSPAPNVGASAGSTVTFSAPAEDPDGNPIAYTWTVNGQVVSGAFGPQLSWQVPETTAGGTYTVTVTVTDGSRITQNTWTINTGAFHSPRVLFDDTHSEMFTLDPARVAQLGGDSSRLLTNLATSMQNLSYNITDFTAGPITSSVLSNNDVLILASPLDSFTSDEMQAIWTFVNNGGGLIFLAMSGIDPVTNDPLLAPFGLQVDGSLVQWQDPGYYPYQAPLVDVSTWVSHPSLSSLQQFQSLPAPDLITFYAASFTVSPPAVALGSTPASAWHSSTGQVVASPGDGLGPFVIVAASQVGAGRVFAVSSAGSFGSNQQSDVFGQDNLAVYLSGLTWVSAAANPAPSLTPAPAPAFSAAVNGASFGAIISPGSWASILGKNLAQTAPGGQSWSSADFHGNQLPQQIAGTSVLINGRPAAISFVSPAQLNVQPPDDTASGQVPLEVSTPLGIVRGSASLAPLSPAIFPISGSGITYAAAVSTQGVLIAHPQDYRGARAAEPGETIEVFGTGFGPATPPQPAGQLVQTAPLTSTVTATLCGVPAAVPWAGLVAPGLDQINLTIPSADVSGDCSVQFSVAGILTQTSLKVPIQ